MNLSHNTTPIQRNSGPRMNWKKIIGTLVVVAVVAYQAWEKNKHRFGGNGQPAIGQHDQQNSGNSSYDHSINFDPKKSGDNQSQAKTSSGSTSSSYLKLEDRGNLRSPGGLLYASGRNEHRKDHVLRHAADIPNRSQPHGVFYANGDEVFQLIDEAYEHVKKRDNQAKVNKASGDKLECVIDMKRAIGFKGGQPGKRQNNPKLYKVKLILGGTDRVITAYPY